AHVQAHVGRIDRPERLLPARQRVVERERHVTPAASGASLVTSDRAKERPRASLAPDLVRGRCNNTALNIYGRCARGLHRPPYLCFPLQRQGSETPGKGPGAAIALH